MHPIPHLMEAAEAKWAAMLQRQSSTLDAAVKEYKRRYGMAPPDGFDLWFEYARSNNLKLVDEYDDLMATLAPLRRLGPKEARRRAENMLKFGFEESIGGLVIDAKDGVFSYWKDPKAEEEKRNRKKNKAAKRSLVEMEGEDEGGYRTRGLLRMLEPLKDVLGEKVAEWPAFAIPVNELAEARVVGGDDEKWKAQTDALETKKEKYELDDLWHRHQVAARTLSEDLIHACDANSRYGKMAVGTRFEFGIHEVLGSNGDLKGEGSKAEFVTDPNADNDMCERPELMAVRSSFFLALFCHITNARAQLHGVHRGTRSTTKGLYPMLSYGHPSAFNDIAIPSRYQWDVDGSYEYYDGDDVAWEEKESKIYWRGEPSGGGHGDQYYGSVHPPSPSATHPLTRLDAPPPPRSPNQPSALQDLRPCQRCLRLRGADPKHRARAHRPDPDEHNLFGHQQHVRDVRVRSAQHIPVRGAQRFQRGLEEQAGNRQRRLGPQRALARPHG